jgi:DNA-binding NtrC family response regulator
LLRGGAAESARDAFTAATRLSGGRRGLLAAARLGETLCGRLPARGELEEHLRAVEAFGDLRLWAFCLAEVRRLAPEPAAPRVEAAGSPPFDQPAVERALDSEGPWPLRVCRALRALHHRLPWWRAGLLDGGEGWEARWDLDEPRPLPAADLFGLLPRPEGPPVVVDLGEDPALRDHPARALHALRFAVVASLAGDARLVLGLRGTPPGPEALRALAHLVWLVDRHRPVARDGASGEARPSPRVNGLLGRCEAMRALLADIDRMAPSDLALHVWGETGTGKERVARALHDGSPRRGAAFVAVNASSLSDELFESEMFGHVRGAFTGALADREGHVGSAQGGTLFLDEVADLSPRAQARLLRFLEQHEYRRVGESRLRRADVRVVTAANAVLSERVAEGRFRPDLMYRLERLTLRLPPLRERGEDVVLLARHFLRAEAQRARLKAPELSREAARLLERHAWPGNVRELENEMSRLVWMGVGGLVRPEHLAPRLREGEGPAFASLRDALTRCERAHLQRTLAGLGGHRARAAAALGISRQALLTKMVRHGL